MYPDQILGDPKEMASITNETTFPNLYKLLGVAFTLPISRATCKRSLSGMRRVKTRLRFVFNNITRTVLKFIQNLYWEIHISNNITVRTF